MKKKLAASAVMSFLMLSLSACNGTASDPEAGLALGQDETTGQVQPLPESPSQGTGPMPSPTGAPMPAPTDTPAPAPTSTAALGPSCSGSDGICLSLKYVVYKDGAAGAAALSETEALANLATINQIWSACGIAFEFGKYEVVNPSEHGLSFNTPTSSELNEIRGEFEEDDSLLVVTTGAWSGSLGSGSANAWANMPGSGIYGIVLEAPVGNFGNIVAHELGHYLNLGHYADATDVMNAVIYQGSTKLTTAQCNAARSASNGYWAAMQR